MILPHNAGWDVDLINNVIHEDDVVEIKKIKLNSYATDDLIGWHYTTHGNYTVKLGYWLVMQEFSNTGDAPYGSIILKRQVWKLNIPPKLQHFLWRLLSNTMAVGSLLFHRRIISDPLCKRCCTEAESLDHLFFSCPYAQSIWRAAGLTHPDLWNVAFSFDQKIKILMEYMQLNKSCLNSQQLPVWILWRIWKSRNQLLYQQKNVECQHIIPMIWRDMTEWTGANSSKDAHHAHLPDVTFSNTQWRRPPPNFIKCNYDCSYINDTHLAVGSWVLRDTNGVYLEAGSINGNICSTVLEAEAQALLMAMQHVWCKGYRNIVFEGDNKVLYGLLMEESNNFSLTPWLREIRFWSLKFQNIVFSWVKRSCNKVADVLAKNHNRSMLYQVFNLVPHNITTLLYNDYMVDY